jgi:N-carbamoyl-L-amino-acid hydrolase
VKLVVELRDLDAAKIKRLGEQIQAKAREIGAQTKTQIEMRPAAHHDAAMATPEVQASIERACEGTQHMRLPSGAGHDAQAMALLGPMGMIFVPSVAGVSHSPKELTHWQDCVRGTEVLMRTVLSWAA